jgi:hypothetical protein
VFNFLNGTRVTGQGGFIVAANAANFPALLTGNGAMAVGVSFYHLVQIVIVLFMFLFD